MSSVEKKWIKKWKDYTKVSSCFSKHGKMRLVQVASNLQQVLSQKN